MEKFLQRIKSSDFWIGVVFWGIIINLASNYIQRALDKYTPRLSAWLRGRRRAFYGWLRGRLSTLVRPFAAIDRVWFMLSLWRRERAGSLALRWGLRALREVLETAVPAIVMAVVINLFLAQAATVLGQSMEPNLHGCQRVVIEKVTYRFFHGPRRGDVIVIDLPEEMDILIKRAVGLSGETIEIREGEVYVEGRRLEEPWEVKLGGEDYGPVIIPPLHVFVLGDNRPNSRDSRTVGPVHLDQVIGRAWLSYWPVEHAGLVH